MYETLIKALRKTSMNLGEMDTVSVLLIEAANAIEDLRKRVPPVPHGRLIDADALMKDGWKLYKTVMRMGGYAIHEKPLNYPDVPTIIEAEGANGCD